MSKILNSHKTKYFKGLLCLICILCLLLTSMPINTYAATNKKVALSSKSISMDVGNNKVLKLNNAKGNITWKSSNTKIVSIKKKSSNSVTLSAKKKGNATITATYKGKKYTCKVNIAKPKMKYDTWEEETVMLGYINTVSVENSSNTISWSIDDPTIASIKPIGNKNQKCEIEALTHGETTMRIIDGDTTHIMKVIVPEVKLDVAKIYLDGSEYYQDVLGTYHRYSIYSFFDENCNNITNTFELNCLYLNQSKRNELTIRFRKITNPKSWLPLEFIGTDIIPSDLDWESSNPNKIVIDKENTSWHWHVNEFNDADKGSTIFTTKLGNETFSFEFEWDFCALPN